jgi:hypothetical protein
MGTESSLLTTSLWQLGASWYTKVVNLDMDKASVSATVVRLALLGAFTVVINPLSAILETSTRASTKTHVVATLWF